MTVVYLHPSQADLAKHFPGYDVVIVQSVPAVKPQRERGGRAPSWTAAELAILTAGITARETAAAITSCLPGRTRDACLGQARRAGLRWDLSPAEKRFYQHRASKLAVVKRKRVRHLAAST